MRVLALILLMVLSGCTEKYAYMPQQQITESEAKSIIEQVLMEQPIARRPEVVQFTPEFILIGNGIQSKGNSVGTAAVFNGAVAIGTNSSNVITKGVGERIYYNSIGETQIFTKRKSYLILMLNADGKAIKKLSTSSQVKAQRFSDAMNYLKNNAPSKLK